VFSYGEQVGTKYYQCCEPLANHPQASKGLPVIFLAAGVVGFVPEVVAQIVSTVVQVGAGTAIELQSRHRANTFLDEMNEKLFKPR
jgi:hypothetical protein